MRSGPVQGPLHPERNSHPAVFFVPKSVIRKNHDFRIRHAVFGSRHFTSILHTETVKKSVGPSPVFWGQEQKTQKGECHYEKEKDHKSDRLLLMRCDGTHDSNPVHGIRVVSENHI